MDITGSVALDALSILFILILLVNISYKNKKAVLNNQYFIIMVLVCVFLALDAVYYLFYGNPQAIIWLQIVKSLYFAANCLLIRLWARFIGSAVYANPEEKKSSRIFYDTILAINLIIIVQNVFTGNFFTISPAGTFEVGYAVMWIFTGLNYLIVLLITLTILKNRKSLKRGNMLTLLLFPLPPLCAEIIQLFFRPLSLTCMYAVSVLIIFQIAQNNAIYTDALTGLFNRRQLNESLDRWLSDAKGETICGIMIDLDGLKKINDTYGHLCGDSAIVHVAQVIQSLRRKDIISARYGGDEFVLVWRADDVRDIQAVMQCLEKNKEKLNRTWPTHEQIDFSMGCFYCRDVQTITVDNFIKQMDKSMYETKKEKRQKNI